MTLVQPTRYRTPSILSCGLALLMLPALAGPSFAANDPAAAVGAIPPPSALTFDQKLDGKTVTVKYAHLPKNGYIVIFGSDADGKPTKEPLGHVALKSGDHRDIKVELSAAPAPKTRLWTGLYEDKDGDAKLSMSNDASFWADRAMSAGGMFQIQ
jgi:hypothetical protein